jgi:hypothetical protein
MWAQVAVVRCGAQVKLLDTGARVCETFRRRAADGQPRPARYPRWWWGPEAVCACVRVQNTSWRRRTPTVRRTASAAQAVLLQRLEPVSMALAAASCDSFGAHGRPDPAQGSAVQAAEPVSAPFGAHRRLQETPPSRPAR